MERMRCRPRVHVTVNRLQRINISSICQFGEEEEGKEEREGKCGEEKGTRHHIGGVYQWLGG